ncbi:MAG TPA: chemotaxis protein CheW [Spirochaetia bacterium]|nr:chemotaxis protein CheW [Spirochaetia bacterium]
MEVKAEYRSIFCEEAADQLREWEGSLLALEKTPGDSEQINRMFRAVHTLKGSAGFIGLDTLQKTAHALESSLQEVREQKRPFDSSIASLIFEGLDLCRSMIEAFTEEREAAVDTTAFLKKLSELGSAGAPRAPAPQAPPHGPAPAAAAPSTAVASVSGEAPACRLSVVIEGQPRESYLRSFLVKSRLERVGRVIAEDPPPESLREGGGPFAYIVTLETEMDPVQAAAAVSIDQVIVTPALVSEEGGDAAEAAAAASRARLKGSRPEEVVRVSVSKLDVLLNLVGELVIHNSGFIAAAQQLREEYGKTPFVYDLEQKTEALSAITRELQEGIMKARMLPVANVFNRFNRVVRDLSKASGKAVTLEIFGEETEIDKKVIDRIGEPLVHLIRNAVDHGIEPAAERIAAGKRPEGTIRLGAYQDGDTICVEVSDDGRGLDREAVVRKALEKGLLTPEEAPKASAERVFSFIFLPGFSTAEKISEVSGRGVGMDVVKSTVEEMSGTLRVRSTPHAGTTVTINLPLTMAIISAILVEVSGSTFAVPLSGVREILKTRTDALKSVGGRRVILLREEVLPLVHLGKTLMGETEGAGEEAPDGTPVVVVDFEGRKIGLQVERIVGTREIVIKSLSRHYREIDGLIGASILGNGRIALIIDVESLISRHHAGAAGNGHGLSKGIVDIEARDEGPARAAPAAKRAPQEPAPGEPAPREPVQSAQPAQPASPPSQPPSTAEKAELDALANKVINSQGTPLEEVNNTSAIQASMSLSQFTGREIRVSFPESRLVPLGDVAETMGGEENTVGGIFVEVQGEISGGILIVLPFENIFEMEDLVHGRPVGTTSDLAGVDLSALCEMGNILAASFINTMADSAHLTVQPGVPEISVDMCLPVIDGVLARFNQPGDSILLTEAVIYGSGAENVVCHLMLFLEPESLAKLLEALEAGSASSLGGA